MGPSDEALVDVVSRYPGCTWRELLLVVRQDGWPGVTRKQLNRRLYAIPDLHWDEVLRLPAGTGKGTVEFVLPSGDREDVLFQVGDEWHAVEVKSALSDAADVTRGIFQCVKYRALIEAFQATKGLPQRVTTSLVLEGPFPAELVQMQQILGVLVLDGVCPS